MTKAQIKESKRQELLTEKISNGTNFELIQIRDKIKNEVVISKNVGGNKTGIILLNPNTCTYRFVKAQNIIIDNQPITYIILN